VHRGLATVLIASVGCGSGTLLADAIDGGVDAFVPSPPDAELIAPATAA